MTAGVPADEDAYIREVSAQRAHELQMAEVEADTRKELARIAADNAARRRTWLGGVLGGLLALAIIAIIAGSIVWNINRGRQQHDRDQTRDAQIAETCIRDGNVWFQGNCIPATRKN